MWQLFSFSVQYFCLCNVQVEGSQSEEDLNSVCDVPKYSTIIDRSGWPIGRLLNLKSKGDFITYILVEELVGKRIQLLQNFREGLDYFGLIRLIKESQHCWDTFISLVKPPSHLDDVQGKAYALFMEFIKCHMGCTGKV